MVTIPVAIAGAVRRAAKKVGITRLSLRRHDTRGEATLYYMDDVVNGFAQPIYTD